MQKTKVIGWAAAFGLAFLPSVAQANDTELNNTGTGSSAATNDQCMNDCMSQCNSSTSSSGVTSKKKQQQHAQAGSTGTGTGTDVYLGVTTAPADQSAIDEARAEERARAAEEFRAEEQRMNAEHQAELDQVRSEERARADNEIAQARDSDQRKMDQASIDRSQERRGPVIEKALVTPVGVYGAIGGGVGDFTQPSASGTTGFGGNWDARLGVGTRSILGVEADYTGGARDISALGLENQAFLMNNGIEGVARLNVPITVPNTTTLVEPYTFGGIGWQHYDLVDAGSPLSGHPNNTSDVQNSDDIMTVPLGVGLDFAFSGFNIGVRGTYRQAFFNDLLGSPTSSFAPTSLNSWETGATLGFEF